MKMNVTYKLIDVLDALNNASQTMYDVVAQMKKDGVHEAKLHCFEIEGALTTSPYARVTFTHRDGNGGICGHLETCAFSGGPRTNVKVIERWYSVEANNDFTHISIS